MEDSIGNELCHHAQNLDRIGDKRARSQTRPEDLCDHRLHCTRELNEILLEDLAPLQGIRQRLRVPCHRPLGGHQFGLSDVVRVLQPLQLILQELIPLP